MEFQERNKKDRLGRGLEALLGPSSESEEQILSLSIEKVTPDSNQPRQYFEKSSLEELSESIKTHGVLQPILVKARGENYEIIAGERRWRAAGIAGLHKIPAIVKKPKEKETRIWALLENLQREDLNPLEEARAYQALLEKEGFTVQALAELLAKPRSSLVNVLRLLNLDVQVQKMVGEGKLSFSLAKELLRVKTPFEQRRLAEKAIQENWTVRDLIKASSSKSSKEKLPAPSWMKALVSQLEKRFSRRVSLSFKKGAGKMTFHFRTKEELNEFVEKLCQKSL